MKFVFVTLFPEQIEAAAGHSVLKRALDTGIIAMECVNPRDFSLDRHHSVDDAPFGGGVGMVLKPEPVVEAIKAAKAKAPGAPVIAMSPGGVTFRQSLAETWAKNESGLIFVCGHALMIMDAVSRFVPGVLGKLASAEEDSFSSGLLEYPQYTRPVVFEGMEVPEVLRNGNHQLIARWRRKEALKATYLLRPDMLPAEPDKQDAKLLQEIKEELSQDDSSCQGS